MTHTPDPKPLRVTLTFDLCEADLVGEIADLYAKGRTDGITEEGSGSLLVGLHPARHGYISWQIEPGFRSSYTPCQPTEARQ